MKALEVGWTTITDTILVLEPGSLIDIGYSLRGKKNITVTAIDIGKSFRGVKDNQPCHYSCRYTW